MISLFNQLAEEWCVILLRSFRCKGNWYVIVMDNWSSNGLIVSALASPVKLTSRRGCSFCSCRLLKGFIHSKARCSEATRFSITLSTTIFVRLHQKYNIWEMKYQKHFQNYCSIVSNTIVQIRELAFTSNYICLPHVYLIDIWTNQNIASFFSITIHSNAEWRQQTHLKCKQIITLPSLIWQCCRANIRSNRTCFR